MKVTKDKAIELNRFYLTLSQYRGHESDTARAFCRALRCLEVEFEYMDKGLKFQLEDDAE